MLVLFEKKHLITDGMSQYNHLGKNYKAKVKYAHGTIKRFRS